MRRQEYIKLVNDWNEFLLKESLIKEDLLVESILLEEGYLSDIAKEVGKKGILFLLANVISSSPVHSKDTSVSPIGEKRAELRAALGPDLSSEIERRALEPEAQEAAEEIIARLKTKNTGDSDNQASFKGFLTPEDLERFHRETGKKVFSQENMSITSLPGVYVKETFELDRASGKELSKIIEKAKKIYNEELDERTFLITVNGKKYAVVVEADEENSKNNVTRLLNRWSINIANSITELVITEINSNDKKLIERAQECRLVLNRMIADNAYANFSSGKYFASFVSANDYKDYFWNCTKSEVNRVENPPDFSYDNSSLSGVITFSIGYFKSRQKKQEAILIHELGHLLSDQSGTEIVDTHLLKKFYRFLANKKHSKVKKFNLKDIGEFLLREELSDHDIHASGMLSLLSKKSKRIILKASRAFANQLLGGGAIEAIDDQNFSFIISIGQAYYSNLEERIENMLTVANSIYTIEGSDPNAAKLLKMLKKKNPSMEKQDLQNLFDEKYIEFVSLKRETYFKSLINDILESGFFDLNFENMDSSILNKRRAKRIIRSFINKKTRGKKHFKNFDDQRLMRLINLSGFDDNPAVGARRVEASLRNLIRLADENIQKHAGHDHEQN